MATGTISWFNHQKGYGFIKSATDSVYLHHNDLKEHPSRSVEAGQDVRFDVEPGHKGLRARSVTLL